MVSLRDAHRAVGPQLAVQGQVEHARQLPCVRRAAPLPPRGALALTLRSACCCCCCCAVLPSGLRAASERPWCRSAEHYCALAIPLADAHARATAGGRRHCRCRLRSRAVDYLRGGPSAVRPPRIRCLRSATSSSRPSRRSTRTARAAGNSAAGARSPGAPLAPSAASSSTPPVRVCGRRATYVRGRSECLGRGNTFLRHDRVQYKCTLHVHTRSEHLALIATLGTSRSARGRTRAQSRAYARERHLFTLRSLRTAQTKPPPRGALAPRIPATAEHHGEFSSAAWRISRTTK